MAHKPSVTPMSVLPTSTYLKRQLFLKGTHDHEASTSSASHVPHTVSYQSQPTISTYASRAYKTSHQRPRKIHKQGTKKFWIQKTFLQAQRYYNGNSTIWIPKHKQSRPPYNQPTPNQTIPEIPRNLSRINRPNQLQLQQVWKPNWKPLTKPPSEQLTPPFP